MSGRASRRRLAEIAEAARHAGVPATRGARLAARMSGQTAARPCLGELATWPSWPGAEAGEQARVWRIAALVAARDAVGHVIDGEVLRAYAATVGDDALEAVLALPEGGDGPLVSPARLASQGRQVAERGLPSALAVALCVPVSRADTERDHVVQAERIARECAA
jgi:hypothetical protein